MGAAGVAANRHQSLTSRSESLLNLRLSELGWFFLINSLLFENFLDKLFSAADYFDEAATILLFVCAVFSSLGRRDRGGYVLSGLEKVGLGALAAMVAIGLLGNYVSGVQLNATPILIDLFACIKFPVALLSGYFVFRDKERLYALLLGEAKVLLLIMLPFAILNQFVDIGMRYDMRYGLHSFQFIFGHPASLTAVVVGLFVLFLADMKQNRVWFVLCWVYLVLSLRSTAIAFAAFSFLIWLTSRRSGRISAGQIAAFALVALYFGWSQLQYYFVEVDGSARRMLLDVGFQIANRYFPLGSGFATYASNVTGQPDYYSSLYSQYGLSGVYGLTIDDPSFLSDSFWPIVFGQFGWVGASLYIATLAFVFYGAVRALRSWKASTLPFVLGFSYLLLTSMSSSAFFNPLGVFIAVCVSFAVCSQERCERSSLLAPANAQRKTKMPSWRGKG